MLEAILNPSRGDHDMWVSLGKGDTSNVDRVLGSYTATTDFPACWYYKELMRLNPKAKVILTVRDPEKWYQSCRDTIFKMPLSGTRLYVLGLLPSFNNHANGSRKSTVQPAFNMDLSKENCIKVYLAHVEEVKKIVPADQLLIYEVKEGWEPLCKFLGKPVPSVPYPNVNDTAEFQARMTKAYWIDRFLMTLIVAGGVGLAVWARSRLH